MGKQAIKRYSMAFKKQVVKEYEEGSSISELQKRYGITGATTIKRWVEQYGKEGVRHRMMVIQSPEEQGEVKYLRERNAQLERVVAQLTLEKVMLESTLKVVEENLGVELKKSIEAR